MKQRFLTTILIIVAFLSPFSNGYANAPAIAAGSDASNMPMLMKSNIEQMMMIKTMAIGKQLMIIGMQMCMIAHVMMAHDNNDAKAKKMIADGIKLYMMGMAMNGNQTMTLNVMRDIMAL